MCIFYYRVILQLSSLCQRTLLYNRNVLEKLLTLLNQQIVLDSSNAVVDPHLTQWLILLVSHILSSPSGKLSMPAANETQSDSYDNLSAKLERNHKLIERITDYLGRIKNALDEEGTKMSSVKYKKITNLKSELKKKCEKLDKLSKKIQEQQSGKGSFEKKTRRAEIELQQKKIEKTIDLPPCLVEKTSQGLTYLLVKYCQEHNWDNVPTVCKVMIIDWVWLIIIICIRCY